MTMLEEGSENITEKEGRIEDSIGKISSAYDEIYRLLEEETDPVRLKELSRLFERLHLNTVVIGRAEVDNLINGIKRRSKITLDTIEEE